jgi:hypothetical protein
MQIGREVLDAADRHQLAAARGFHCLRRFSVRHQRIERQRLIGSRPHQHHAERVGDGKAGRGENRSRLFLDLPVNARAHHGICGHARAYDLRHREPQGGSQVPRTCRVE